ncbi:MAG: hypothetical protein AAGA30_13080, partial [Planctomycetota bacterium]
QAFISNVRQHATEPSGIKIFEPDNVNSKTSGVAKNVLLLVGAFVVITASCVGGYTMPPADLLVLYCVLHCYEMNSVPDQGTQVSFVGGMDWVNRTVLLTALLFLLIDFRSAPYFVALCGFWMGAPLNEFAKQFSILVNNSEKNPRDHFDHHLAVIPIRNHLLPELGFNSEQILHLKQK